VVTAVLVDERSLVGGGKWSGEIEWYGGEGAAGEVETVRKVGAVVAAAAAAAAAAVERERGGGETTTEAEAEAEAEAVRRVLPEHAHVSSVVGEAGEEVTFERLVRADDAATIVEVRVGPGSIVPKPPVVVAETPPPAAAPPARKPRKGRKSKAAKKEREREEERERERERPRVVRCAIGDVNVVAVGADGCSRYLDEEGRAVPVPPDWAASVSTAAAQLATPTTSVLALALDDVFVALVRLRPAPVVGAVAALRDLAEAGVRTILVSGATAAETVAGGVTLGLLSREQAAVKEGTGSTVHGPSIGSLTADAWDDLLARPTPVFARATPHDKRTIVTTLQTRGIVTAVVAADVTNVLALQAADVALTVGEDAAPDAVHAADFHLVRGDLRAILPLIQRSRALPENLARMFDLAQAHVLPQLVPAFLTLCAGMPPALTPASLIIFNLGTEVAPSVALALQNPETDLLRRPPTTKGWRSHVAYAHGVAGTSIAAAALVAFFVTLCRTGIPLSSLPHSYADHWHPAAEPLVLEGGLTLSAAEQTALLGEAQSSYFLTVALAQLWHTFFLKSTRRSIFSTPLWDNKRLNAALALKFAVIVVYLFTPAASQLLGAALPGPPGFLLHFGPFFILFFYSEFTKAKDRCHCREERKGL
jgi:hypothetical protein